MAFGKTLKLLSITAFGATSIACGDIQLPQTLALVGEDNVITMTLSPDTPAAQSFDLGLEGGVDTTITLSLSLLDLLVNGGLNGLITVDELLFAGTPFEILGIPTGEVCIVPDQDNPGGGSVLIDILAGLMSLDAAFNTRVLLGNELFASAIPDGFPFPLNVQDTSELSIADLIGLIFGNADGGGMLISQELSDQFEAEILPGFPPIIIGVEGNISLGTVNEFPTGDLIDACDAFLSTP